MGLVGLRYDFATFVWCFGRVLEVADDWAVFRCNVNMLWFRSNVMHRLQEDDNPSIILNLDEIPAQ